MAFRFAVAACVESAVDDSGSSLRKVWNRRGCRGAAHGKRPDDRRTTVLLCRVRAGRLRLQEPTRDWPPGRASIAFTAPTTDRVPVEQGGVVVSRHGLEDETETPFGTAASAVREPGTASGCATDENATGETLAMKALDTPAANGDCHPGAISRGSDGDRRRRDGESLLLLSAREPEPACGNLNQTPLWISGTAGLSETGRNMATGDLPARGAPLSFAAPGQRHGLQNDPDADREAPAVSPTRRTCRSSAR